ncbi:threonine aldolase family protein [Gemella cuniculi]|uniref:threonine aldolase family protein n=1 Tax=Gemella cuniculi TaxID=150240 RepID=UPI00040619DD|nr:aminotransferase class I/II-fold pyridoxal phosphate-dependent enzyme [Gemella cuniculi]
MTLFFANDYSKGAHPKVLEKLVETNMKIEVGYGFDTYCDSAKEKIRKACGKKDAEIFFLTGGTQTNATVIKSLLRPYEGVIAVNTGHISTHEAGIIEAGGHKVIELNNYNGKLNVDDVREYINTFYKDANRTHMVMPGMVYITYPTEYGTLYTKEELNNLYKVCKEYDIPLFVDGARLGYGLMARECDITFQEFSSLCDVFYIGGTKIGALCGEAVVFSNTKIIPQNYTTFIKQMGALLAKGRLLGVQFDALFTDNLYFEISKHAIDMAELLKETLKEKGYKFFLDSPTNQQFVVIKNEAAKELEKKMKFAYWEKYDNNNTIIRFVTDWATQKEDIEKLIDVL